MAQQTSENAVNLRVSYHAYHPLALPGSPKSRMNHQSGSTPDPQRRADRTYWRVVTRDHQVFELYQEASTSAWVLDVVHD